MSKLLADTTMDDQMRRLPPQDDGGSGLTFGSVLLLATPGDTFVATFAFDPAAGDLVSAKEDVAAFAAAAGGWHRWKNLKLADQLPACHLPSGDKENAKSCTVRIEIEIPGHKPLRWEKTLDVVTETAP